MERKGLIFLVGLLFVSGCSNNLNNPSYANENNQSLQQNFTLLDVMQRKCFNKEKVVNFCKKNNDYGYLEEGNSMLPLIKVNDKIIEEIYDGTELNSCEIIRFKYKIKEDGDFYVQDKYFVHRIIGFNGDLIITGGDNNSVNNYEIVQKERITHRICGVIKNG